MSLIYTIFITILLLGIGYWISKNYASVKDRNGNIHWHRLIANNVYLMVLRLPGQKDWEIKISIISDQIEPIVMVGTKNNKKAEFMLSKNVRLIDLDNFISEREGMDPVIKLFLEGLLDPPKAAPLFPHPKDYDIYKEFIFYLKTSLEKK